MIIKTYLPALLLLTANFSVLCAQTFTGPAIGLKSHQTMEVIKVELSAGKTTVYFSIENRINNGTFCADRNIFLNLPGGSRLKLEKASGIPVCPGLHKFKRIGETLEFTLTFPALTPNTGWIDIVEECGENCFSVYGVLLNEAFSRRIDEAMMYVDKGQTDTAIGLYQSLINDAGPSEAGIAGSLYSDLISLLAGKGYTALAGEWYRKLVSSDVPGKQMYIDNLNFRGIKY